MEIEMARNLEELKTLNNRLTSLLEDPQLGLFTWHMCLAEVLNEIAEFSPDKAHEENLQVKAECHTDDHAATADFDAAPWFKNADDKDILELVECGFGGDYPADNVAIWMATHNIDIKRMFQYLETRRTGFECHVDPTQAVRWIKERRPHLMTAVEVAKSEGMF